MRQLLSLGTKGTNGTRAWRRMVPDNDENEGGQGAFLPPGLDNENLSEIGTMIRKTSNQFLANDNREAKAMSAVDAFTPDLAAAYARKMVERESRGNGDQMNAMERVGRECGLTSRSLRRLINGETKDPSMTLFGRVRAAYLRLCERDIAKLKNEIAADKARFGDAAFEDLANEVSALAEKLRAAKERAL